MKPSFEELVDSARAHSIKTSATEFGFETRLMASIRENQEVEGGFLDTFGSWLWKGGLSLVPVVGVLVALATIFHSVEIPDGTSSALAYIVNALPFSDSTLLSR